MRTFVRVTGPKLRGPFETNSESHHIEDADAVVVNANDTLSVTYMPFAGGPRTRAHNGGTVTYAKGEWTKFRINEIADRPESSDFRCETYRCGECRGCKMRMASV